MKQNNKIIYLIVAAVAVILILSTTIILLEINKRKTADLKAEISLNEENAIKEVPKRYKVSPINGLKFEDSEYSKIFNRKPLAVMINNHFDSRPSYGVDKADVVYEVVAEGGITRFLAIFQTDIPDKIRSVRSARYYFAELASAYYPHFIHWGAAYVPDCQKKSSTEVGYCPPVDGKVETNPKVDAYKRIVELGLPNLDGLNYECYTESCAFTRDQEKLGVLSKEHTAMIVTKNIYDLAKRIRPDTNWQEYIEPHKWEFIDEDEENLVTIQRDSSKKTIKIHFNPTNDDYNVEWKYNPDTNLYERSQNGIPFIDDETGKQVTANTLIMRYTEEELANDKKLHMMYTIVGTGKVEIYQNGAKLNGNWSRPTYEETDTFTDQSGEVIKLQPGKIWVSLVNENRPVEEVISTIKEPEIGQEISE